MMKAITKNSCSSYNSVIVSDDKCIISRVLTLYMPKCLYSIIPVEILSSTKNSVYSHLPITNQMTSNI